MQALITENREKIVALCRAHHVRRLAIFGSATRDDFDPSRSDVDLLVDFEELPYPQSVDNSERLKAEFAALFARPIDLISNGSVRNPYIRRAIREDEELLYAA